MDLDTFNPMENPIPYAVGIGASFVTAIFLFKFAALNGWDSISMVQRIVTCVLMLPIGFLITNKMIN